MIVRLVNYSVSSAEGSSDIISLGDDGGSQDVDGIVSGSVFTTHIDVYSTLEAENEKPMVIRGFGKYVQS